MKTSPINEGFQNSLINSLLALQAGQKEKVLAQLFLSVQLFFQRFLTRIVFPNLKKQLDEEVGESPETLPEKRILDHTDGV